MIVTSFSSNRTFFHPIFIDTKDKETAGLVDANRPIRVEGPPTGSGSHPPVFLLRFVTTKQRKIWKESRKTSGRVD